jgi:hypothetical protein
MTLAKQDLLSYDIHKPTYRAPYVQFANDKIRFWQRNDGNYMLGSAAVWEFYYVKQLSTPTAGTISYALPAILDPAIPHYAAAQALYKKNAYDRAGIQIAQFDAVIQRAGRMKGRHGIE